MGQAASPVRAPGEVSVAGALLMTAVGGFIDAYLFLRHGVFAFAQTGNVVFLAVAVVQGRTWTIYLWPILAYITGLIVAQVLRWARPALPSSWILAILIGQIVVFAVLAALPASAGALGFVVPLAFIGGIRLDLFRSAGGSSFVSIATTGNLMRFVQSVATAARDHTAIQWRAASTTGLVVVAFVAGAFAGAGASALGPHALWGAVILELVALVIYASTSWRAIRLSGREPRV